ncbi:3-methylornithine--L-lysine ligase PylC [Sporomusa sp. KB1]|jgi:pyrrolysine biosynthesis protein PylC|uniref:3-methylornithine--L-lysine ligase PylC n=1 Tax=Sporomusa sp. KB1 TaxID=943346 RepID=UPI00119F9CBE|nr:3-methylornithine--L-lysine ligase PylC [Sporomusa sp. KB1]TWH46807.1 pyrrolysine biosynthesis protein PylC [Sporomusa sp. KB1]
MQVAVLGGKLQGVEACYLAKKAGWDVLLVDKNPEAPAVGLCDRFLSFDLLNKDKLAQVLREVQFIVPALENKLVLDAIYECAQAAGVKVLYDQQAYRLSASKLESDKLFAKLGIPAPKPWPDCQFPVTVKPSGASGSKGVYQVQTLSEFNELLQKINKQGEWVVQEFLAGPSYSIEIAGINNDYRTFQVTELEMDAGYDCKRVLAPAILAAEKIQQLADCALVIAKELQLNGIMDVEVILHEGKLKVLEIDARLPSQTLTAVFKSTGINVLEVLGTGFGNSKDEKEYTAMAARGVIYEHIKVGGGKVEVCGEHIMGDVGPLHLKTDFFGAEEAITNYHKDKQEWVATLMVTGENRDQALQCRKAVIKNIMNSCGLKQYQDLTPPLLPNTGKY